MRKWYGIIFCFLIMFGIEIGYLSMNNGGVIQEFAKKTPGNIDKTDTIRLREGDNVEQHYNFYGKELDKIILYFQKLDNQAAGSLFVKILDRERNVLSEWNPSIEEFEDKLFMMVFFNEEGVLDNNSKEYWIEITVNYVECKDALALLTVTEDKENSEFEELMYNGAPQSGKIMYMETEGIYQNYGILIRSLILFGAASAIIILLFVLWKLKISQKVSAYRGDIILGVVLAVTVIESLIYNCSMDILFLISLFFSALIVGREVMLRIGVDDITVWCGVGLCIIGVFVCYVISLGFGAKWIYALIITVPILFRYKDSISVAKKTLKRVRRFSQSHFIYMLFLGIIFSFYLALGSRPIGMTDSLKKHLPISIYAAETGTWFDNIIENIVAFSESTMLHYSYTTMMVSFDCYKALTLFNVFLLFILFAMYYKFAKRIYNNTNKWLLMFSFFSVPYIMNISTIFTVDIFPIYIVFTFVLLVQDMEYGSIVKKIPVLAFLTGCAVYTKLTILSCMLVLCVITFVLFTIAIYKYKQSGILFVEKYNICKSLLGSVTVFVLPFIFSFAKNLYMTGNPFSITAYNHIFKSPYFGADEFSRPFTNNGFGVSLRSFWDMAFHTDRFAETYVGAMGYIWLFVFLIPIALFFYRNKKFVVWLIASFSMLQIAGIVVGNMRYVIAALLLVGCLIVISISIISQKVSQQFGRKLLLYGTSLVILIPNIYNLITHINWSNELKPRNEITICENVEVLRWIPENSKVIAFNDDLKGDFKGFYYPVCWHNEYTLSKIINNEIDSNDFIEGFDYAILKKTKEFANEYEAWGIRWCNKALESGTLTVERQTPSYILFKVNARQQVNEIFHEKNLELVHGDELVCETSNIKSLRIISTIFRDNEFDEINDKKKNNVNELNDNLRAVVIEIVGYDERNNLVDYKKLTQQLFWQNTEVDTGWIEVSEQVDRIRVRIINENKENIQIQDCEVQGMAYDSVLEKWTEEYYKRSVLK